MKKILFLSFISVALFGMETSEENKQKKRAFAEKKMVPFQESKSFDKELLKEKLAQRYVSNFAEIKIVEEYRSKKNPASDVVKK